MSVLVLGVSHHSSPITLLDEVAVAGTEVEAMLAGLVSDPRIEEAMVLATCNRLEVYASAPRFHPAVDAIRALLARYSGVDPDRLRQVLNNLISNAIKYSPDQGVITVSGRYDDQHIYIAVSDQGIGIPAGERDRIFDRFYRVESALSRRTQGAGLGLYLAKSVIEAHRGRIWVSSSPGQGSTFVFSLPRDA